MIASFILLITTHCSICWAHEPVFSEPIGNLTVPLGRDAIFTCPVNHLNDYTVGWVKADTKAIQAIDYKVVTQNSRVSVERSPGSSMWKLLIKNVKREDAGAYMCQINTDPMKSQVGYLDVMEPPDIDDDATPSDQSVVEYSAVTLNCRATGRPLPSITWKKEHGRVAIRNDTCRESNHMHLLQNMTNGQLCINKVTRRDMGSYLCIASNGVPPSVSKRINLVVLFAPSIKVQHQLQGVPIGGRFNLKCKVEASPNTVHVWYKDSEMIVKKDRYTMELIKESLYSVRMILSIVDFRESDQGRFSCRAKNSMGQSSIESGTIRIYAIYGKTHQDAATTARTTAVSSSKLESILTTRKEWTTSTTTPSTTPSVMTPTHVQQNRPYSRGRQRDGHSRISNSSSRQLPINSFTTFIIVSVTFSRFFI